MFFKLIFIVMFFLIEIVVNGDNDKQPMNCRNNNVIWNAVLHFGDGLKNCKQIPMNKYFGYECLTTGYPHGIYMSLFLKMGNRKFAETIKSKVSLLGVYASGDIVDCLSCNRTEIGNLHGTDCNPLGMYFDDDFLNICLADKLDNKNPYIYTQKYYYKPTVRSDGLTAGSTVQFALLIGDQQICEMTIRISN